MILPQPCQCEILSLVVMRGQAYVQQAMVHDDHRTHDPADQEKAFQARHDIAMVEQVDRRMIVRAN